MDSELISKPQMLPVWKTTKNAFRYYWKRFKLISGIVALPLCFYLIATVLYSFAPTYFWGGTFAFLGFITAIFSVLAIYQAIVNGEEEEILACYKKGAKKFFSFLWLVILMSLIMLGGYILAIIPGIILSVWFTLSAIIFFVEDDRGLRVLVKSRNYVRGYWWPIFGRVVFLSLLMMVISFVTMGMLGLSFNQNPVNFSRSVASEWANLLRLVIVFVFLLPFQISFIYSLYLQLKKIKAEDAGVSVISRKTRGWFIGLAVVGVVVPIVTMLLIFTFALGGILGFLVQDANVNGVPVRAWLYNRGLIEDRTVLIDQSSPLFVGTSTTVTP